MSLLPNTSPKLFSLSAVTVGYLLLDDLSATEQNAMGNWLMLVAQVLCTNGFYKQYQTEHNRQISNEDAIDMLNSMITAIQKEINNINDNLTK